MKKFQVLLVVVIILIISCSNPQVPTKEDQTRQLPELNQVQINDPFWSPKLELWSKLTVNDVFDKFDGKHEPHVGEHLYDVKQSIGRTQDAFLNFDLVARGERGIGQHDGPPWFDGLIYETIRAAADFLIPYPDQNLKNRIDAYIDRISAAQASDPDGYINTYTQLMEPDHRWGFNGGWLRWQHDVYNAGMLFEAAVHYYKATGETKLLSVAVKFANFMCDEMGDAPRKNVVPAHSGPEEGLIKLYWLFQKDPKVKEKLAEPVNENQYYDLAKFWIEGRGNHCGFPLWKSWGDEKSVKWLEEAKYTDPQFGPHSRPSLGEYAQDSLPFFEQKTIEGHAVRATLFATGIASVALENKNPRYIEASSTLWDNMAGKRMFITGGVGAIAHDEKFGPDYYLPNDAYLETCAAVGAGFFSQRMNELTGNGKYMDEFERALYNNVLSGVSQSGDHYSYQNPLVAENHPRWSWHGCPCCPPMFLKMVAALPGFIYSYSPGEIYVNLFIGSEAKLSLGDNQVVSLKQSTRYPWDGKVTIEIESDTEREFSVKVRIPGWAQGIENPYGLYHSELDTPVKLSINGKSLDVDPINGYVAITRKWKKGDVLELTLPMQPRFVSAHDAVGNLNNMLALASGPLVYCFEEYGNHGLADLKLDLQSPLNITYNSNILNGVNIIEAKALVNNSANGTDRVAISAVPFYSVGNQNPGSPYKVWIPKSK